MPILVGAPGDGSLFLNSMKLWAMRQAGLLAELRLRARPPRRGLRVVRLPPLGAVHPPRALARHPDPGRRRAEELQPAAGAGARPGAGPRGDPRLHLRRPDRQRAGDRRVAVVLPAGRGGDLGQGGPRHLPADHREHAGRLLDGDAVPGQGAAREPRALRRAGPPRSARRPCSRRSRRPPATCAARRLPPLRAARARWSASSPAASARTASGCGRRYGIHWRSIAQETEGSPKR